MAIAFDAATDTATTSTSSVTFSHTCTGSDRLLIVPCASLNNGTLDAVTGVTYNGTSLTRLSINTFSGFNWVIYLYYLVNPDTGANNVVVTRNTSTGNTYGSAISYTGVDQTSPIDANTTDNGTGSPVSTALTSTVDNAWFFITGANPDGNMSASTNSTLRGSEEFICSRFDNGSGLSPAGSLTMEQTYTGSREWRSIMLSMKPVAAAATDNAIFFGTNF